LTTDPFRTRDHVADFDDKVVAYRDRSAATRARLRTVTVRTGTAEGEALDLFFPAPGSHADAARAPRPVHLFIHGGYWRMFSKDDFSYVADTVTATGAIAAVLDYALMPAVRLAAIVGQVRRARRWIADNIATHGGDPARVTVSGHSAGAHLATFLFTSDEPDPVSGALLLGGLYDLRPLQSSFLEPLISLTDEEVRTLSPLDHRHSASTGVRVLWGARETAPFHEQGKAFARHLADQGADVVSEALADADHMSSALDLGSPDTETGRHLVALINGDGDRRP
jgi:arylformamidase